jgi:hypothetical protein
VHSGDRMIFLFSPRGSSGFPVVGLRQVCGCALRCSAAGRCGAARFGDSTGPHPWIPRQPVRRPRFGDSTGPHPVDSLPAGAAAAVRGFDRPSPGGFPASRGGGAGPGISRGLTRGNPRRPVRHVRQLRPRPPPGFACRHALPSQLRQGNGCRRLAMTRETHLPERSHARGQAGRAFKINFLAVPPRTPRSPR